MHLHVGARRLAGLFVGAALVSTMAACAGPTEVDTPASSGQYDINMSIDPTTIKPPQQGTISFGIFDRNNKGKVVANFTPVYGTLAHNILVRDDLSYFNHSTSEHIFVDANNGPQFSLPQFWPTYGHYTSYALFQPQGSDMITYVSKLTVGTDNPTRELREDTVLTKSYGSVQVQFLRSPGELKAGQPSQLVFHVTERGHPVNDLWPVLGAPGHLWVLDQDLSELAHETGAAAGRQILATATAVPSSGQATPAGTSTPAPGATGTSAVPTIAPEIASTIQANNPFPTLVPVAQTAQVSVVQTPLVQPGFGYGPDVIFSHTFPKAGLYKMWVELYYGNNPITVDFTVMVSQ